MLAAIVVIGNELLSGYTKDANGPHVAARLREQGHRVVRITIVPDDVEAIVDTLEDAFERGQLVFTCGGLGPTEDDVTIDAVARFLDRPLGSPREAKDQIRRIYRYGEEQGLLDSKEVDEGAWRMARVPEGGTVVPNGAGAAPGSVHEAQGGRLFVLPGPPEELRSVLGNVLEAGLLPRGEEAATCEVVLNSFEAPVSQDLAALAKAHPSVEVGSYPQAGKRRVLVRLRGPKDRVVEARAALVDRLGDIVMGEEA